MFDALDALDPMSRQTASAFIAQSLELNASGMHPLLAERCEFQGALSAGLLRGRMVVASHIRQVFKGVSARGVARLRGITSQGREVAFTWEVVNPDDAAVEIAEGSLSLLLDDSGLISRIEAEWDPRPVQRSKGQD